MKYQINKKFFKKIPKLNGVYQFKNNNGDILYIGKAKNLRSRLSSYMALKLEYKTKKMVSESSYVEIIKVASEFEALILEAQLVKAHKPKYNIQLKDDKSPLYIGITQEKFPRVISFRLPEFKNYKLKNYYGPFIKGGSVKLVLKLIRSIIPFCDHKPTNRACLRNQIGLCNPCSSEIITPEDLKNYRLNIRRVKAILNGKFNIVRKGLEKEMKIFSKTQNYEQALIKKKQLELLNYITTKIPDTLDYVIDPNLLSDLRAKEIKSLKKILQPFFPNIKPIRIECYDIAHLSGTHPTASMVTFIKGEPERKFYRHFKIYGKKKRSDTDSMREVLRRRIKHLDNWGKPDLIIVDGGKGQLSRALEILESTNIPVIGIAKKQETLILKTKDKFVETKLPNIPAKFLIQRLRDESHRFARRLHHKLVTKALLI